jgi:hypothetical protein
MNRYNSIPYDSNRLVSSFVDDRTGSPSLAASTNYFRTSEVLREGDAAILSRGCELSRDFQRSLPGRWSRV